MRTSVAWRLIFIFVAVSVVAAFGVPLFADEAQAEQPQATEEQKKADERLALPVGVEEIVVTAQKREENVQDVPAAISTIAGEDLQAITAAGPDVRILSARVPSLILESSFGRAFPRFYIRGLGNTDFDLNASQPVSMLVDEIVLENPVVKGMPLWDLDRVEVLRGPQGTLFGRNTPAGAVKFETKKPGRDFEGEFRVSFGQNNTVDVDGGIGGPLGDTLSARFSGLYQYQSDWVDNGFTHKKDALGGYETTAYRVQLLWEPSEEFNGLLNIHGWDLDGTARIFRANIIKPGTDDLVDGFQQDVVYQDGLNKQKIKAFGGLLRLQYDFGPADLVALTGYESLDDMFSRGDIDGGYGAVYAPPSGPGLIPFSSESADGIPSLEQWTQEVRVASKATGSFDWLVGAFAFSEDLTADTYSYDSLTAGNPQNGFAFQKQKAKSYALFGSTDYRPSDKWNLTAGLRYTTDKKDFQAERPWPTFQTPTVAPITAKTDAKVFSWNLSATYKVNPNFNVYSRLATGFRAPSIQGRILFCADFEGGTNPATNCVSTADTEKILSFETGFKSILADNRLRLNMTAYIYEVKGQQVTAVGGRYNTATLLNVDKTKGHGLETDLEYIPTGNVLLTFGFSYNPTKIDDPTLSVAPCGGGCTVLDPIGPNGALVDGNSLPNAPDWIVNGILNVRSDPVNKGYFAALDWAYYSEKHFFLYDSAEFKGDGYDLGLRLGYAWNQAKYEVALYGRNVTDQVNLIGGIDFDNLTGMTNDPRLVGVEFVGKF